MQCRKGRATGRRRAAGLAETRRETEAGQCPARVEPSDLGRAAAEGGREERRAEAREREGDRATVQRKVWRTDAQREGGRAAWSRGRTAGGDTEGGMNRSSEDVIAEERDPLPLHYQRADSRSANLDRGMSIVAVAADCGMGWRWWRRGGGWRRWWQRRWTAG
jgi:hypothetical protein